MQIIFRRQGEHAAAQAAMAIQSLFVAYDRNRETAKFSRNPRGHQRAVPGPAKSVGIRSRAIRGKMRQVNALLR